ncbi:MAG: YceK/YidQ family lipoprotein [Oleispira sp.]|nr:YceK/YidQ family lipoprotein [Oleispira sp.]MBL4880748.1 YceK/YidQ family lipoprotein [Oleispira sp.]
MAGIFLLNGCMWWPTQYQTGSPVGLVDMAASFVTDIILLPVDLLVEDPGGSKEVLCEIKWGP